MRHPTGIWCGAAFLLALAATPAPVIAAETQQPNTVVKSQSLQELPVDKIRKYFKSTPPDVDPVQVSSLQVKIGATVPGDIQIEPLPGALLVDMPAGVDYRYFLWGDSLVIVNAENRTVVAIIPKTG